MPKTIAFLRAINVGGRNVRMEELRQVFESLGLAQVETFIASGNVIFEAGGEPEGELQARIENGLQAALGYEVTTFLRSDAEVSQVARYEAFSAAEVAASKALNVAFLAAPLRGEQLTLLAGLKTTIDDFQAAGRELYWLCREKQSDSTFSNALFERRLKLRATFRGLSTLRKLAAKYPPGG